MPQKLLPKTPNTKFEQEGRKLGYKHIAGVDEAGRGPLAGPVVAACCIIPKGVKIVAEVNDSKLLTPLKRKSLLDELSQQKAISFSTSVVDVEIIDRINILQATLLAMEMALEKLPQRPDYILVDGGAPLKFHDVMVKRIIKGDRHSYAIACASNIAKVTRDAIMEEYDVKYPEYGFKEHKGYGTPYHLEMLAKFGPSPIHRKSFAPIKTLFQPIG